MGEYIALPSSRGNYFRPATQNPRQASVPTGTKSSANEASHKGQQESSEVAIGAPCLGDVAHLIGAQAKAAFPRSLFFKNSCSVEFNPRQRPRKRPTKQAFQVIKMGDGSPKPRI